MTTKTKRPTKTPRAREYTGPNTLEDVKEFLKSNATQKAKVKAMEALSHEDQVEIMKWVQKFTLDALKAYRTKMDAEWKRRGFDIE